MLPVEPPTGDSPGYVDERFFSPSSSLTFIATSESSTCLAWSDRVVACVGKGSSGELGDGRGVDSSEFVPIALTLPAGVTLKKLVGGSAYFVLITSDGSAYVWGEMLFTPTRVDLQGRRVMDVAVEVRTIYFLLDDGSIQAITRGYWDEGFYDVITTSAPRPVYLPFSLSEERILTISSNLDPYYPATCILTRVDATHEQRVYW